MSDGDTALVPLENIIRDFRRRVSTGNYWLVVSSTDCGSQLAADILDALQENYDEEDPEVMQGVGIEINGVQSYIITIRKDELSREKLDKVTGHRSKPGVNVLTCTCTHLHVIRWVAQNIKPCLASLN